MKLKDLKYFWSFICKLMYSADSKTVIALYYEQPDFDITDELLIVLKLVISNIVDHKFNDALRGVTELSSLMLEPRKASGQAESTTRIIKQLCCDLYPYAIGLEIPLTGRCPNCNRILCKTRSDKVCCSVECQQQYKSKNQYLRKKLLKTNTEKKGA